MVLTQTQQLWVDIYKVFVAVFNGYDHDFETMYIPLLHIEGGLSSVQTSI